jgi:hypothetical protein
MNMNSMDERKQETPEMAQDEVVETVFSTVGGERFAQESAEAFGRIVAETVTVLSGHEARTIRKGWTAAESTDAGKTARAVAALRDADTAPTAENVAAALNAAGLGQSISAHRIAQAVARVENGTEAIRNAKTARRMAKAARLLTQALTAADAVAEAMDAAEKARRLQQVPEGFRAMTGEAAMASNFDAAQRSFGLAETDLLPMVEVAPEHIAGRYVHNHAKGQGTAWTGRIEDGVAGFDVTADTLHLLEVTPGNHYCSTCKRHATAAWKAAGGEGAVPTKWAKEQGIRWVLGSAQAETHEHSTRMMQAQIRLPHVIPSEGAGMARLVRGRSESHMVSVRLNSRTARIVYGLDEQSGDSWNSIALGWLQLWGETTHHVKGYGRRRSFIRPVLFDLGGSDTVVGLAVLDY